MDSDAIFSMMAGMLNHGTTTAVTVLVTVLLLPALYLCGQSCEIGVPSQL